MHYKYILALMSRGTNKKRDQNFLFLKKIDILR